MPKHLSEEHKLHLSQALKGRKLSDEHLAKLRANAENRRGTKSSDETRAKQSVSAKLRRARENAERGLRPFVSIPCECGCGTLTAAGRRFIHGHYTRLQWQKRSPEELLALSAKIAKTLSGNIINNAQRQGLALGHLKNRGDTHWNWKGGRGRLYPREFRELRPVILERDGYRCVMCKSEAKLVVHHVDYNKQHNDFLNLVTLCQTCNLRAESRANKDSWPVILTIYTQSLMPKGSLDERVA